MEHIDENGYIVEPEQLNQEYESSFFLMITYDVLVDKRLTDFQRLLYAAITGLCRKNGYCWASNSYFENLFGKTTDTIIKGITKLVNLGYLRREMVYKKKKLPDGKTIETKEVSYRKLFIVLNPNNREGGIKNNTTGPIKNHTEIDNPIIDNPTSNNLSKDILLEDNTVTVVQDLDDKFFNNIDDEIVNDSFSKDEEEQIPNTPPAEPKKKKGLAPLYDMVDEKYDKAKYPTLNVGLKTYLKAHLGKRRLPSEEKWNNMLKNLEEYSSVQLPGASGTKFMEPKALEIVEKAITGKDGVPYLEFDDIYHSNELKEPTFNLNRDFTKGY